MPLIFAMLSLMPYAAAYSLPLMPLLSSAAAAILSPLLISAG
jgi:hypothetical protein